MLLRLRDDIKSRSATTCFLPNKINKKSMLSSLRGTIDPPRQKNNRSQLVSQIERRLGKTLVIVQCRLLLHWLLELLLIFTLLLHRSYVSNMFARSRYCNIHIITKQDGCKRRKHIQRQLRRMPRRRTELHHAGEDPREACPWTIPCRRTQRGKRYHTRYGEFSWLVLCRTNAPWSYPTFIIPYQ